MDLLRGAGTAEGTACPMQGEGTSKLSCFVKNGVVKEVTLSGVVHLEVRS